MQTQTKKIVGNEVPRLRFPGFTIGWKRERLGKYLMKHEEKTASNNQYPVLTSSQRGIFLQKDYFAGNDVASRDTTGYNVVPRNFFTYRHMSDTLVFKFNINNIVDRGIVSTLYPVFTTKEIDDSFLLLKLNEGLEFKKYAVIQKQGGSRTYMYYSKLKELGFSLPTIQEQQKIASFLSSVDAWIENLKSQKQALETYKKGLMQKFFSQEIRFKDNNGKDFPEWEEKKAGELFENYTNKNHMGDLPLLAVTQENGVVFRNDLDLRINTSEVGIKSYKIIEPGNFVISLRSFQGGIEYSDIRGISSPAYTVLRSKIPICDNFYKLFFKKDSFIRKLSSLIYGIRDGKQISFSEFKIMKLSFPCILEQQKIADFLTPLDNLIETKQKRITQANHWKKGLMQQMFV